VTGFDLSSAFGAAPTGHEGWFTFYCAGMRNLSNDVTNVAKLAVGDEVSFIGGFKVKQGPQATADLEASAPLTVPLTFTVMDSGAFALIALTSSSAVAFLA